MAIRYCGSIRVSCKIAPVPGARHGEQYRCAISVGNRRLGVQYVGFPGVLDKAVDSPKAYDEAASAAISFAMDEEERGEKDWGGIGDLCEWDEVGRVVRRQKPKRS